MGTDVSVVIVSYNTRELLRDCLRSVYASTLAPREVFVVDNASRDGSAAMVEADFPAVRLIAHEANLRLRRRQQRRLAAAAQPTGSCCSTPTRPSPPTLSPGCRRRSTAGQVPARSGPRILNPDGSLQSCGYRFPTLLREIRQSKRINRAVAAVLGPRPRPRRQPTRP